LVMMRSGVQFSLAAPDSKRSAPTNQKTSLSSEEHQSLPARLVDVVLRRLRSPS